MDDNIVQSISPQQSDRPAATRHRQRWRSWTKLFLMLGFVYHGAEKVPGVITRPLGPCDVDWFYSRGGLVVLSCPHVDGIKLWPLPIEYP